MHKVGAGEAKVGGCGTVGRKAQGSPQASKASIHGKGTITRKDGTVVHFELCGETDLSESALRERLGIGGKGDGGNS